MCLQFSFDEVMLKVQEQVVPWFLFSCPVFSCHMFVSFFGGVRLGHLKQDFKDMRVAKFPYVL